MTLCVWRHPLLRRHLWGEQERRPLCLAGELCTGGGTWCGEERALCSAGRPCARWGTAASSATRRLMALDFWLGSLLRILKQVLDRTDTLNSTYFGQVLSFLFVWRKLLMSARRLISRLILFTFVEDSESSLGFAVAWSFFLRSRAVLDRCFILEFLYLLKKVPITKACTGLCLWRIEYRAFSFLPCMEIFFSITEQQHAGI